MLRALFAQGFEESWSWQDEVHVSGNRLDDHAGDLRAMRRKQRFDLRAVVVIEHKRVLRHVCGHAGGTRVAEGQRAGARLDQQAVRMAVVTAFEFDDLVASRVAARKADRGHRRLRARGHQPHHFDRRHQFADQFRQLDLRLGGRAEGQRARRRCLHRLDHGRMRVPGHHRTPGSDIVDVAHALCIPQVRTGGAFEKARRPAHGAKCAHRGIHPCRNALLGAQEKFFVTIAHAGRLSKRF